MSDNEKPWLKSYPSNVRYHLDYPDKTLGQLLDETVAKMPDTLAMIFEDQTVTYRQFGDQVNRLVAALADMGIEKGERVGPVSYTHLRAHETRHDLVCRLLLEKKKKYIKN